MFVMVALGGWGERTLTNNSKVFLGILGTVLTLIGLLGIILVVYPVVRPNVILIQQDLNIPNPLSTPLPKPTPTPLPPREQAKQDAIEIGSYIIMALISLPMFIMLYGMAIGTARMMMGVSDFPSPPRLLPRLPRMPRFRANKTPKDTRSIIDQLPKNKNNSN